MKKTSLVVLKCLALILLGLLAGCSAPSDTTIAAQVQSTQPDAPVITVYKAPT